MWISRVELHNIKSYGQKTKIDLAQGLNAICGQNGSGKSTILEAIGYAIFGKSAYQNQSHFINEKAKKGEIVITLVDNRDDREYEVVRPIKGGMPYVFDPETKRKIAEDTKNVQRWLRDCMGIEPTTDLKALFENAIGVPQGMLTASFLETVADRRKVFDPLLEVEDYNKVWANMLAVVNHVKDSKQANARQQALCTGRLVELPDHRLRISELTRTMEDIKTGLLRLAQVQKELEQTLNTLVQQKRAIEQFETKQTTLGVQTRNLEEQLNEANATRAEAANAKKIVEQCEADYFAYEQVQKEQKELNRQQEKRKIVRDKLIKIEKSLAGVEQTAAMLATRLQDIAGDERKLVELAPLVRKQEALETEYRAVEKMVADLNAATKRVAEETDRLTARQQEYNETEIQVARRKKLQVNVEQLQHQRNEMATGFDQLNLEIGQCETELVDVRQSLQQAQSRQAEYQNSQNHILEIENLQKQQQQKLATIDVELKKRNDLQRKLDKLTVKRATQKDELLSLEVQLSEQEADERRTQKAVSEWQSQVQTLVHLQHNLERAEIRLAEAKTALAKQEEEIAQRYRLTAQLEESKKRLAEENGKRDAIKSEISRYQTRLTDIANTKNSLEQAGISGEKDVSCPVCQKSLSYHEKTSLLDHYQQENDQAEKDLADAEIRLKQAEATLKSIDRKMKQTGEKIDLLATSSSLPAFQKNMTDTENEVTELKQQVSELIHAPAEVAHHQQLLDEMKLKLAEIKKRQAALKKLEAQDEKQQGQYQTAIAQLARESDILELNQAIEQEQIRLGEWQNAAATLAGASELVAKFAESEQLIVGHKTELQRQSRQINNSREQLAAQIQTLQAEITNMASPSRLEDLHASIETQTRVVNEWQERVTEFAPSPAKLKAITDALKMLDDPRDKQRLAQAEAEKRPAIETDYKRNLQELEKYQQNRTGIMLDLEPFAGLDSAIEKAKETLNVTETGHQTYLKQKTTADTLPGRTIKVKELQKKVDAVVAETQKIEEQLAQARLAYDPGLHISTEEKVKQSRIEHTRLETQLENNAQIVTDLEKKITSLEQVEAELEKLKQKAEELDQLSETIDFIRHTIKDAGPEITRQLVKTISMRADQFFCDIMNDHQQELSWDETYEIIVRHDGYKRYFQQLSGGEAMAAALAVRLALLQTMSSVDVAFFDEPTANLDPERRVALAEQIARIKGFKQLVVISHDDTFEQDTNHVIHIGRNEHGHSQVVSNYV